MGGLCRILPGGVVGRVSFRPWAYSRIWHAAVSLGASFLDPFTAVIFPGTPFGGGILGIFPAIGAGRFFAVVPDDRSGLLRFIDGQHYFPDVAFRILAFFKVYAPTGDSNNPSAYADFVAKKLQVTSSFVIKNLL